MSLPDVAPGMRVYWLHKNMPGVVVGPAQQGPWDWEIKFDAGGRVLAYAHEVVIP